jgi:hypothetical protein
MDWTARAIGPASEGAQSFLQEHYYAVITISKYINLYSQ